MVHMGHVAHFFLQQLALVRWRKIDGFGLFVYRQTCTEAACLAPLSSPVIRSDFLRSGRSVGTMYWSQTWRIPPSPSPEHRSVLIPPVLITVPSSTAQKDGRRKRVFFRAIVQ